jgi:DNA repair protein RadC
MATDYSTSRTKRQSALIRGALRVLEQELREYGPALNGPEAVRSYLRLRLGNKEREQFLCLFLDAQNQLIDARTMFEGTLTQTTVHPREVVRAALQLNAASLIVAHNHPSGSCVPTVADRALTAILIQALALIDVRLLDHFVVGRNEILSFAQEGILK